MGTRGCKELCLSGVGHIQPASVRMDLELSQWERTGQRSPEERVTSPTCGDSSWCEVTGQGFLVKRGPVTLISLMDLCIGGASFIGPFFFSWEPVVRNSHVCD